MHDITMRQQYNSFDDVTMWHALKRSYEPASNWAGVTKLKKSAWPILDKMRVQKEQN